jgi:hypothetical protein
VVILYIFPILVFCTKKNLATLMGSQQYDGLPKVDILTVGILGILQLGSRHRNVATGIEYMDTTFDESFISSGFSVSQSVEWITQK